MTEESKIYGAQVCLSELFSGIPEYCESITTALFNQCRDQANEIKVLLCDSSLIGGPPCIIIPALKYARFRQKLRQQLGRLGYAWEFPSGSIYVCITIPDVDAVSDEEVEPVPEEEGTDRPTETELLAGKRPPLA